MPKPTIVLIAAPDFIPALRDRLRGDHQLMTFGDTEPMRAMRAVLTIRPDVVALERLFAATPRGAALIARIKRDARLDGVEIRVLSHDSNYQRVSPRRDAGGEATPAERPRRRLDPGTRRATRYLVKDSTPAAVNGQEAQLVNLSTAGAQLVVPGNLRPKQAVEVALGPARKLLEVAGTVVWARIELSRKGPQSRIGVNFTDPDERALEAFLQGCRRR